MTTQGLPGDRNHHPLDCGGKCGMGHEQQPEEPKYTESDMRVLTEAALRLGRKEALDEAAARLQGYAADPHDVHGDAANGAFLMAAGIVRGMAQQDQLPATSGRTDPEEGA